MIHWTRRTAAVLSIAALSLAKGPATHAQQPAGLFIDVAGAAAAAADQRLVTDRTRIRSRTVRVDLSQLGTRDSRADAGTTLQLNLFEDVSYHAVLDRIDLMPAGFVWVGHIAGVEMSTVSLATEDGVVSGTILTPEVAYEVRFAGAGLHSVVQIDQSAFPPEGKPLAANFTAQAGSEEPAALVSQGDDGSFIDVMVLYTPAAVAAAGGSSAMNALISNSISVTNTTYGNSGVSQRLRLVHAESVAYSESGALDQDLVNITNGIGTFAGVNALRNRYAADLVTLLTHTPGGQLCGIAWLMDPISTQFAPGGYSAVEQSCAVGNLTFPHELGHNMGLRHDWYIDNALTPYTYGHGYVNLGSTPAATWRTIMAYPDKCQVLGRSCPKIMYFSNPSLLFGGVPIGVPAGTSTACTRGNLSNPLCDADEHRVLNNTAFTVANFRQAAATPLSLTSLTPNVALPVTVGAAITWTATASGGTPPLQYQFWRYTEGVGWSVAQGYGSNNSYTWFPPAGTHALQVWVRNAGSTANYDAWLGTGYFSVVAPTARLTAFSSSVAFPVSLGVPITFTATAAAGSAPVEYKFWRYSASSGWAVARDYSPTNAYTWFPPRGSNAIQVWVRTVGSTDQYQDWTGTGYFDVLAPSPKITAITANVAFPAAPSTTIRWTASASGGTGPLEYKFYRYSQSSGWVVLRDWNQSNQASWVPGAANLGEHLVQVWIRSVGSSAAYEDLRSTEPFLIVTPQVNLTPNRALTGLRVGDLITWTASVSGASGDWEYKFLAFDGTTWKVMQDYSTRATFSWFPPAKTCAIQVWVRALGSSVNLEQYQGSGLFVVSP